MGNCGGNWLKIAVMSNKQRNKENHNSFQASNSCLTCWASFLWKFNAFAVVGTTISLAGLGNPSGKVGFWARAWATWLALMLELLCSQFIEYRFFLEINISAQYFTAEMQAVISTPLNKTANQISHSNSHQISPFYSKYRALTPKIGAGTNPKNPAITPIQDFPKHKSSKKSPQTTEQNIKRRAQTRQPNLATINNYIRKKEFVTNLLCYYLCYFCSQRSHLNSLFNSQTMLHMMRIHANKSRQLICRFYSFRIIGPCSVLQSGKVQCWTCGFGVGDLIFGFWSGFNARRIKTDINNLILFFLYNHYLMIKKAIASRTWSSKLLAFSFLSSKRGLDHDLILIRHAESQFNVACEEYRKAHKIPYVWKELCNHEGFDQKVLYNMKYADCAITERGRSECAKKRGLLFNEQVDCVLVSPQLRALETCHQIFKGKNIHVFVQPLLLGPIRSCSDICKSMEYKKLAFPNFNFAHTEQCSEFWYLHYLPEQQRKLCAQKFKQKGLVSGDSKRTELLQLLRRGKIYEDPIQYRKRIETLKNQILSYRNIFQKIAIVSHYYTIEYLCAKDYLVSGAPKQYLDVQNCHPYYCHSKDMMAKESARKAKLS